MSPRPCASGAVHCRAVTGRRTRSIHPTARSTMYLWSPPELVWRRSGPLNAPYVLVNRLQRACVTYGGCHGGSIAGQGAGTEYE